MGPPGIELAEGPEGSEIAFPAQLPPYQSSLEPVDPGIRQVLPDDTIITTRLYTGPDGFWLRLLGVLMLRDRSSIHQPELCLVGQGFSIRESFPYEIQIGGERPYSLPVMVLRTEKEHEGRIYPGFYIYWFVAEGRVTAHHWERMWWMARDVLLKRELQRWAYVGCMAITVQGGEKECLDRMIRFLSQAVPRFQPPPESSD